MHDEVKTISNWAQDVRVPLSKLQLWKAVNEKKLPAFRPIGAKSWLIKWSDLSLFLTGQTNG